MLSYIVMKIICILALLIFLSPSVVFASGKFEAGLFFGSYQPSFSRVNDRFYGLNLSGSKIQGFTLDYRILPDYTIRLQMGFSEYRSHSPHPQIDIRLKTTIVSVLGVLDLIQHQNYKLYGGMGLVDCRIHSNEPILDWPPGSKHDFSFPWGTVVLLGIATPLDKSYQLKGEIQYVAGTDGKLMRIPLDWDGLKFLVSIGIKF